MADTEKTMRDAPLYRFGLVLGAAATLLVSVGCGPKEDPNDTAQNPAPPKGAVSGQMTTPGGAAAPTQGQSQTMTDAPVTKGGSPP